MKKNKMITVLGIVLLASSISSLTITRMHLAPTPVPHRITQGQVKGKVAKEPSDEEIMSYQQFTGLLHELTEPGLSAMKKKELWKEIQEYYKRWATVDRQGAASEFKPRVQD